MNKIAILSIFIASAISSTIQTQPQRKPRIFGGSYADISEIPYIIALDAQNGDSFISCGGSLITSKHVLTAAHCIHAGNTNPLPAESFAVGYGQVDLRKYPTSNRNVESVTVHPGYNDRTVSIHDVAIIELKEPVDTSVTSFAKIYDLGITEGMVALAAGWGISEGSLTDLLLKTSLITSNDGNCTIYNRNYSGNNGPTICVENDGIRKTCSGDSGGPLSLAYLPGIPIIGLTSFHSPHVPEGRSCSSLLNTGYFANAFYYIDFISETIGVPKELILYSTEGTLQEKDLAIQEITGVKREYVAPPEDTLSSSSSESTSESSSSESSSSSSSESSISESSSSSSSGSSSSESSSKSNTETTTESTTESMIATCINNSEYSNFNVISYPSNKMYELNKPIMLPCAGKDFNLNFAVLSDYDTYIAFTDEKGYYSPGGITEILIGTDTGKYTYFSGKKFQAPSKRSVLKKRGIFYVSIYLRDQTLSVFVDSELKLQTKNTKKTISQFYLAPFKGIGRYSGIYATSRIYS
ncbi:Chymotrypsin-C [Smittium culicis]|uniref:Chymotrypsin-C n=1 Tax=Smittium culicis TaxID=133412 RepID=A0A1R1YTA2_9FUNG|nr:Chymotrypsin-C [Smittium culicis]